MKKNHLALSIFLCFSLVTLACGVTFNLAGDEFVRGSGRVTSEERRVNGITQVSLLNQGDLVIEVGDREVLVIEAQENLLPYIETEVIGGKLTISTQKNVNISSTRPIRYFLTVTQLEGLAVLSSGNINAPEISSERFNVEVKSSGNIRLDALVADRLHIEVLSSGNVDISAGQVEEQTVRINSSGDYDAARVQSRRANVKINSSGNARLWVTDSLDVEINSSGNLYYRGSPPQLSTRLESSGKVIHTGD